MLKTILVIYMPRLRYIFAFIRLMQLAALLLFRYNLPQNVAYILWKIFLKNLQVIKTS